MSSNSELHADFFNVLKYKDQELIDLYVELRKFLLGICPDATELLYHTHALISVYSLSEKLSDGFCMIPIYTNHLNLGFHKGTLLPDPNNVLKGTGKFIRHIPISKTEDFNNSAVIQLIKDAFLFAKSDTQVLGKTSFRMISKIKTNR